MDRPDERNKLHSSFNENFDCNKMKSLLMNNPKASFGEKFKNWLDIYTKIAKEKIWTDIEYYKSS